MKYRPYKRYRKGGATKNEALYNTARANELGYTPDETGHLPSRDYLTGMILKDPAHPTFNKSIEEDASMGYRPIMDMYGNVYTINPNDMPTQGNFAPRRFKRGGFLGTGESFGNIAGDAGKLFLNSSLGVVEGLTGKNFYDPEFETGLGRGINAIQDKYVQPVMEKLAPIALNALGTAVGGPVGGQVASAIGQAVHSGADPSSFDPNQKIVFKMGGQLDNKTVIEVEGNGTNSKNGELEVRQGKVIRDFKGKPTHENGGFTYSGDAGNIIIPNDLRKRYLQSDKRSRKAIEETLMLKQSKREADIQELSGLVSFDEGGQIKGELLDEMIDEHERLLKVLKSGNKTKLMKEYDTQSKELKGYKKADIEEDKEEMAKGGKINIKPENKGKFTAAAKRAGMGVQEYAKHVLANKERHSSTLVKRANFARNAAGWNHEHGGVIKKYNLGGTVDNLLFSDQLDPFGYYLGTVGDLSAPSDTTPVLPISSTGPNSFQHTVNPYQTFRPSSNVTHPGLQRSIENNTVLNSADPNLIKDNTVLNGSIQPYNTNEKTPINWNELGYRGLAYAPSIYNLARGVFDKTEQLNPKDYMIDSISPRTLDFDPIKQNLGRRRLSALANIRSGSGGNAGTYLSNAGATNAAFAAGEALARLDMDRTNASIRTDADKFNIGTAIQNARTKMAIADINAANRAKRSEFIGKGLEGTSLAAQGLRKERNLENRDDILTNLLAEYFRSYTPEVDENGRPTGKYSFRYKA